MKTFATFLVALFASAAVAQQMPGAVFETPAAATGPGLFGLGGRATWAQRPLDEPGLWLDAHAVLQPLPRLLVQGGWGRAKRSVRGGESDTTVSETRWDLSLGVVLLQGSVVGYVPATWRKVSQRHSWLGDASWTEIGAGLGVVAPLKGWLSLQTETLWMSPLDPHRDISAGLGRETDGSHLEMSVSLLVYVK